MLNCYLLVPFKFLNLVRKKTQLDSSTPEAMILLHYLKVSVISFNYKISLPVHGYFVLSLLLTTSSPTHLPGETVSIVFEVNEPSLLLDTKLLNVAKDIHTIVLFLDMLSRGKTHFRSYFNSTRNMSDSEISLTSQSLNSNFPVSFLHMFDVINVVAHPVAISHFEFVQRTFMLNCLAHGIMIIKIFSGDDHGESQSLILGPEQEILDIMLNCLAHGIMIIKIISGNDLGASQSLILAPELDIL
ncbi:hypothetical protein C0J52_02737 [Blattella germanica]|nr:hypothetical protein C0J52_02737 [Blattella germanica]